MKKKLAILISHPIQYQAPLFKKLFEDPSIDLTVYYCWDGGASSVFDPEFRVALKWDLPLLHGYNQKFLKNYSWKPSSGFFGQINPSILRELRKENYEAIMVYGWNSFTNWLVFCFLNIRKTKILLRGESPLNQELGKNPLKILLKKFILTTLFRRISGFLYIGEENKKFYRHYGVPKEKLFFVPYAVENERFFSEAEKFLPNKDRLRKKLGLSWDDVVVLFAGKLIEKKRPFDLLRAYEKIENPKKALIFLGDGPLAGELKKYCSGKQIPNVKFVGFKNQTEISEYYSVSDILVLPSGVGETWGLVVNEAMCFGKPVVVSDVVGCGPDLVKDGENGYIFPVGDVEKLSEILLELLDRKKLETFGKKSSDIIKKYSYEEDIMGIKKALTK